MKSGKGTYHFGRWGWSMIAFSFVSYLICTLCIVDTVNIYPQAFAKIHGWDANTILSFSSIGGWLSAIGVFAFNDLVAKKGVRVIVTVTGVILGAFLVIFAWTDSFFLFVCSIIVMNFIGGSVMLTAAPSTLLNKWFPRKKDLAFGFAAMGLPFAPLAIIPLMQLGFSRIGPQNTFMIFGIFVIAFSVAAWFWVKNTPEEIGLLPDNEPVTEEDRRFAVKEEEEMKQAAKEYTIKNLVKNRNTWLIGIGFGLVWLALIGIVGQMIPRYISECGYSTAKATMMVSIASAVGIFGSYFWGWIGHRTSTKKASILYGSWFVLSLILLVLPPDPVINWVAVVVVGVGLGGIGNLIPSLVGTCFGRHGYPFASRIISVLNTLIRSTAFMIVAVMMGFTGTYRFAYLVLMVLAAAGTVMLLFVKTPESSS